MRLPTLVSILATLLLSTFAGVVSAQEGHPLAGSWHGEWGPQNDTGAMDLTVIIDWDGRDVTGLVNPVTDRAELENARLDSSTWTVRFEVDMRDASGTERHCVAEGVLDKIGSDRRELAGSLSCDGDPGRFHITRDRDY